MTPNQLPPLPEPDGQMTVTFGIDEKRKVPVFFGCKLTDYALAALAQQAQEPVAWRWANELGEVVTLWNDYQPSLKDVIEQQVKEARGTIEYAYTTPQPQPVPQAMATVIKALQEDADYAWSWHCNVAMAAVDEGLEHYAANQAAARFMYSLANVDTTKHRGFPPAPPVPAPVDEREAFEAWAQSQNGDIDKRKRGGYLCDETQARWHAWQARAALQSTAPQTKVQP